MELIAGRVQPRKDKLNMDMFLKNSSMNKVQLPQDPEDRKLFNPVEVPLLDLLAVDKDRMDSWNIPSKQYITEMQTNRGLSLEILKLVEV